MDALINIQETMLQPSKAIKLAVILNSDVEDEFSYVVVHDPKEVGYSFINVYDEDAIFVGKL